MAESSMRTCDVCEKVYSDKLDFCPHCKTSMGRAAKGGLIILILLVGVIFIWAVSPGNNPTATPTADSSTPAAVAPQTSNIAQTQNSGAVKKAFMDCLFSHGKDDSYSSFDGGDSAIRLMGEACKTQWEAWQDQCIADGGTDGGPGGCTMQAGMLAQSALKLLGK